MGRAGMRLSRAHERALLAACDGRLCMCGRAIWVDRAGVAELVTLAAVDWLEWEGLIRVDWGDVLSAAVLHGPAHHPVATRAGRVVAG